VAARSRRSVLRGGRRERTTLSITLVGPLAEHPHLADRESIAARSELTVGERVVIAISDGYVNMEHDLGRTLLGTAQNPTAGYDALRRDAGGGEVRLPVGCFLLPGEPTVLVDAGVGPLDYRGMGLIIGGRLLPELAGLGVAPEQVDVLALSHLHADHAGWLASADGEPTFPNAQVHFGAGDWEYFVEGDGGRMGFAEHLRACLVALAERGRVTLHDDDRMIAPGITRLAAPGHTPGHSLFAIHDRGERALLLGDAIYCPQQMNNTDWLALSDVDATLAARTRENYLRDLELHGGLGLGCHFPGLRHARMLGGAAR
jgi:glyoxylase-like metal-dependent hydrolase (beta-lactamase superfamily II)